MSIFYKNKGEEPTAKDSLIKECRELLRKNTALKIQVSELEGKVEALENIFNKWRQSNEDIKKNLNPNLTYDGIQEYKS